MPDDRSRAGVPDDELHDDDELAAVLAAELERYATGAVPTVARPQAASAPAPAAPPARPDPPSSAPPEGAGTRRPATASEPEGRDAPPSFARRAAEVERTLGRRDGSGAFRQARQDGDGRPRELPPSTDELPLRRRSGFRAPVAGPAPAPVDPLDRVLPTGPVVLPEPTATLLGDMVPITAPTRPPRHAAPPAVDPPAEAGAAALRGTGALDVPRGLYSDWERSLRSIGRPQGPELDDGAVLSGTPVDTPTVAIGVHRAAPPEAAGAPRAAEHPDEADDPSAQHDDGAEQRRRAGRRLGPVATGPVRVEAPAAEPQEGVLDAEGVDEVDAPHPAVRAAATGAIELPAVEPKPRTGPVLAERVRTAILQLPSVPVAATGTGAAALIARWFGALGSPLALVLATGLAGAGAGAGASAGAAVLVGLLLALPAAARGAAWQIRSSGRGSVEESGLGPVAGRAVGAVLLICRLGAAAVLLFAVAATVAAWAARTGVFGGSASTVALVAASAVAVLATLVAAMPTRATAVLVLLLGAIGVTGTLLLGLVLAPGGEVASSPSGPVAAGVAGFVGVGLLLVLCGAEVAGWRTALPRARSTGAATAVVAVGGGVALVVLLLVAPGGDGDAPTALADGLSNVTAAALAPPVGVLLLVGSVALPTLVIAAAGSSAARLVGAARSARLGTVAAGLLAAAGALGLVAVAPDLAGTAVAAAAIGGVPVAAWAGFLTVRSDAAPRRTGPVVAVLAGAVVLGWALSDGLLPGWSSPVLAAVGPLAAPVRGGPGGGLFVALLLGLVAGAVARSSGPVRERDPADTVEG